MLLQSQRRFVSGDVEDVDERGSQAQSRLGQPDGMDVRPHKILIGHIKAGRGHLARDHSLLVAEKVAVVWASGGAVGEHERGLPRPPGTAGALGVVGRGRRDVAQADDVERRDVDAELHSRTSRTAPAASRRKRSSRSSRTSACTCAVCSRASRPAPVAATVR